MYLLVPAGPIDSPQIWVYRMIPKTAFHKRPQTHSIKVHQRGMQQVQFGWTCPFLPFAFVNASDHSCGAKHQNSFQIFQSSRTSRPEIAPPLIPFVPSSSASSCERPCQSCKVHVPGGTTWRQDHSTRAASLFSARVTAAHWKPLQLMPF